MIEESRVDDPCPSDAALVEFIESRADASTRDALERHVAGCRACADLVAAVMPPDESPLAARVTPPETEPRAARRAPPLRRLALAAGLVLATAALAYGAFDLALRRVGEEVARRATDALGEPVAIGRIGLGLSRDLRALRVHAREVRAGGADGLAAADVELTVPLASLFAGDPTVTRIRLVGPAFRIAAAGADGGGSGRLGGANAAAALAATAPLEIIDGTLTVDMPGTSLAVQHLGGTMTPSDGRLAIVLSGAVAGGTLAAEGELATDANGTLSLTIGGRQLALAALPGAHGRVTGSAELQLRVTGSAATPVVAGRTLVRGGRILNWNPLPTLLAQPETSSALAALSPQLGGADLPFEELRVAFTSGAQGWQIPRLHLATAGIVAGAAVRIAPDRTLAGSGTVRVPPPVANALVAGAPEMAALRDADASLTFPFRVTGTSERPDVMPTLERAGPPATTPRPFRHTSSPRPRDLQSDSARNAVPGNTSTSNPASARNRIKRATS